MALEKKGPSSRSFYGNFLSGRQKYDSSSESLPSARIGVIIYLFEILNVWKDVIFPELRESYPKG